MRLSARSIRLFGLAWLGLLILATPDARAQSGPRLSVASIEPVERRVFAIAGRTLVIRVRPAGWMNASERAWTPSSAHTVRVRGGDRLDAKPYWLEGFYPALRSGEWMAPAGRWEATGLEELLGRVDRSADARWFDEGFWVLAIELPRSARGRTILLDGKPLPIQWLSEPPPRTASVRAPRTDAPFGIKRALGEMLRPRMADPLERWRVRLLTDRLRPTALWGNEPPPEQMESAALEALAQQVEDRWRAALAAVEQAEPRTAERLLHRLTAVVLMPDGSLLPAWRYPGLPTSDLLEDLLSPEHTGARKASIADAWLRAAPRRVAWIMSDAGGGPGDGNAVRVAVSDLVGDRSTCSVAPEGSAARSTATLEGHQSALLPLRVDGRDAGRRTEELIVRADSWRGRVVAAAGAMPIGPPGMILGPFVAPWTLRTWLAGETIALPVGYAAAAMIQPNEQRDGWEVYIECQNPELEEGGRGVREFVRIWIGEYEKPSLILRVEPDGRVFDETHGSPSAAMARRLQRDGASWSAIVDLPPEAIGSDGTLLIGLERIDGTGLRSSWPRALLPRQEEPGRVRIDLTTWNGLSAKDVEER